jgi:hypothetical protein
LGQCKINSGSNPVQLFDNIKQTKELFWYNDFKNGCFSKQIECLSQGLYGNFNTGQIKVPVDKLFETREQCRELIHATQSINQCEIGSDDSTKIQDFKKITDTRNLYWYNQEKSECSSETIICQKEGLYKYGTTNNTSPVKYEPKNLFKELEKCEEKISKQ